MDKRRSILNVTVSIISRILLLFAAFFVRRLLIQYIGNDVNGLNSLYTSIIWHIFSVGRAGRPRRGKRAVSPTNFCIDPVFRKTKLKCKKRSCAEPIPVV